MRPSRRPARLRPLWVLLAAASLAGGAGAAEPAPSDPGEFRYEALPADGSVEVRIDAKTPTFEFKSGRSAYRAFRLPEASQPYLIEIRSLLGGGDRAHARVFYPVAALLNDDFLVSRQTELDALHFDLPVFEDARAPAYRVTIGVDPAQGKERYLVVYTPAPLLAPRPLPEAATVEAAEQAARLAFAGAAPVGTLRITVHPETVPR